MGKIRTAVVGCGNVSQSYIPRLLASPDVELSAICDNRMERLALTAEKYGIERTYGNYSQLLNDIGLDLVVNLTSMNLHAPINKAALEKGINVWCEKPIATDLAAANELLEISKSTGALLACAPNSPASPTFRFMAEAIAEGKLGKVTAANGIYGWSGPEWGSWFYRKGGGALYDLGVYNITTLTGLLGPARSVVAMSGIAIPERRVHDEPEAVKVEAEDNMAIVIDHGGAVFSTVQTGFVYAAQRDDWTIQVIGTGGAMTMLGYDWDPKGVNLYTKATGEWTLHSLDQGTYHWAGGATYIAECLVAGQQPVVTGEHAVHVLEVMQAAKRSAETGRSVQIESIFKDSAAV